MGSVTISTLLILLTLITPALLLVFIYRLFFTRTRSIKSTEVSQFLLCCAFNLAVNFKLFSWYFQKLITNASPLFTKDQIETTKHLLGNGNIESPTRITSFFVNKDDTNIFYFLMDLHLNVVFLGLLLVFFCYIIGRLEDYLAVSYDLKGKVNLNRRQKFVLCLFGYLNSKEKNVKFKRARISIFGFEPVKFFRDAIHHPWAVLTWSNPDAEILMIDILTSDGSLYSGKLSYWVPEGDSYSNISMEHAIRYYMYSKELTAQERHKKEAISEGISQSVKLKSNKINFIKNNGELVLPKEKTESVHLWRINKGSNYTVIIKNEYHLEIFKWYLVLAYTHPGFIKKLEGIILVDNEKWTQFKEELEKWLKDTNLVFDRELTDIQLIKLNSK